MKKNLQVCIVLLSFLVSACSDVRVSEDVAGRPININEMAIGFKNPPVQARAKVYWWWLNGNTDTSRMREELLSIKNAGLGGVDIFEIGLPPASDPNQIIKAGPAFMGPGSLQHIGFALKEAAKLDLEVGLGVASSWNAGGSWVQPEHAAKTVYYSKTSFENAGRGSLRLLFPEITKTKAGAAREIAYRPDGKPAYYQEIAVLAIAAGDTVNLDTTRIINVSAYFNPQTEELNWKAPAGKWDIYRYICSNSGEQLIRPSENSKGPIIDHFDSSATRMHLMYFIDRLKPLVGDFKTSALKYLYLASYEAKDFAWTPGLPAEFRKINGYDVFKFLPLVFNQQLMDSNTVKRFNHDFHETFSELMINNHYRKAKEICNEYGLKINSESGGPGHLHHIPVETLKALGSLDIPRGEYWYNRTFFDKDSVVDLIFLVKEIAAASHIYKRGIVEEESFTSYWDWQEGPVDLKPLADRAFCEGMNRLVIHGFPHNPRGIGSPGIVYFAGTHYNDKVTWWPKVKPFNDYLARISYVLQQTNFVSDVLFYYGEDIPNLVPPKNSRFAVGDGYDYEMINTEILLRDLDVKDGKLVLPGVSDYKVLYTGNQNRMSREVLVKLKTLAEKGAVIIGAKPAEEYGLNAATRSGVKLASLADDLWSDNFPVAGDGKINVGNDGITNTGTAENTALKKAPKGKIYSGTTPLQALKALNIVPDFSYNDQGGGAIDYIHYEKGGTDFYLLRNTTDQWIERNCMFRQQAKRPQQWDPVSGNISKVTVFKQTEKQISLKVSLPPHGTTFMVFSSKDDLADDKLVDERISVNAHGDLQAGGLKAVTAAGSQRPGNNGSTSRPDSNFQTLAGPWNLTFPPGKGAPSQAVFPSLLSWTDSEIKGIKYFSGIATYQHSFNFDAPADDSKGRRVVLDLGDLSKVAEVWLNDKPLGIVWTLPFRYDVTNAIKQGTNTLRIEVANTWSNRLTGDAITGDKLTQTNIVKANKNLVPWNELPLIKSGMLGPVTLRIVDISN